MARPSIRTPKPYGCFIIGACNSNVSSNIRAERLGAALENKETVMVRLNGTEIKGLVNTLGKRAGGEAIAWTGSTGSLAISVVNGRNASR